jgi:hypothetical protein
MRGLVAMPVRGEDERRGPRALLRPETGKLGVAERHPADIEPADLGRWRGGRRALARGSRR